MSETLKLAMELFDVYRPAGSKFWYELSSPEQQGWIRVAHHVRQSINAGICPSKA